LSPRAIRIATFILRAQVAAEERRRVSAVEVQECETVAWILTTLGEIEDPARDEALCLLRTYYLGEGNAFTIEELLREGGARDHVLACLTALQADATCRELEPFSALRLDPDHIRSSLRALQQQLIDNPEGVPAVESQ
jgi:hypothetical protein